MVRHWRRAAALLADGLVSRGRARHRGLLTAALAGAGLLCVGFGTIGVLTVARVAAASLTVCGKSVSLAPGDAGTCTYTIRWSGEGTYRGRVNVALDVAVSSYASGVALGHAVGTEALLDGTSVGLQVAITDSAGNTYGIGTVSCFAAPPPSAPASPPNAAYCRSSDENQVVASSEPKGYRDTFTVHWSFPLAAGNQYQGGGATVTLQAVLTGSASGAVLGASAQPGGVGGAGTPDTGAQLPAYLPEAVIGVGLGLLLAGTWRWRRERWRLAR